MRCGLLVSLVACVSDDPIRRDGSPEQRPAFGASPVAIGPVDTSPGVTSASVGTEEPDPVAAPDGLFSDLPACTSAEGDGELDLFAGCAGAVCAHQTYDDWVLALGEPECDPPADGDDIECRWGGLSSEFDDADADGVVDAPDRVDDLGYFYVKAPYTGRTPEGLGADVEVRCFVDVLGDPSSALFELQPDGSYLAIEVEFDDPDLELEDGDEGAPLDGLADEITVTAPPS